jgi:hypothetical protein
MADDGLPDGASAGDRQLALGAHQGQEALPHWPMPPFMSNEGNYTGSLGNLCRWLSEQAMELGVEIFPGFAAAEILTNKQGVVYGVATGDMGVAKDGSHKPDYQPGMELHAKYTLFAEGARGHLTKRLKKPTSERDCQPQVYGIGIKELWDIDPAKHVPGRVIHTQGWPLSESNSWGGGFLTIRPTTRSRSASSPRSTMPTPMSIRSRNSSAGSSTRTSARSSKAGAACPMARARSTKAAGSRCRACRSPAAR